jgi:hypothetical protein
LDAAHADRFTVFIRPEPDRTGIPGDVAEHPVAVCASYGEARRIRQALLGSGTGGCVIRYDGPAGGGD